MQALLDGPRLEPKGGTVRRLVILLHGYGSDGEDLIGLAPHWEKEMPATRFIAPNAPEPCQMAPMGYQWFPINRLDPKEIGEGVRLAHPALDRFIDQELARAGLTEEALVLAGFSQGTMMALHAGLRRARPPAAIIGFSGALSSPERLGTELTCRPPVCLIHGELDQTIPVDALFMAAEALAAAGVPVRWHVAEGLAHGIDPGGLAIGGAFARDALAAGLSGAEGPIASVRRPQA